MVLNIRNGTKKTTKTMHMKRLLGGRVGRVQLQDFIASWVSDFTAFGDSLLKSSSLDSRS